MNDVTIERAGKAKSAGKGLAPGPRGLPLLGSVLDAWKDPLEFLMKGAREHGDLVRFRFGPYQYFLASDPASIRHVLVDNNKNYTKSRNYDGLKLVLGKGLVTSEGDFWRRQRKLMQPAFHRERLAGFAESMVQSTASMLDRWTREDARRVDAHVEMMRLTFHIVGKTLFGTDVEGEADEVGQALDVALHFANHYAEALVRVPPWVPTPMNVRFKRASKRLDDMVQRIIDERRARNVDTGDLLSMLMAARDEETNEAMTDRQLRDEVATLVLAGHETTANALTWTFLLLSKHPEVERRLHREVTEVLGSRAPSLADLARLPYTSMVAQEVMRLYPPVWTFERQAIEADELLGYPIPAGGIVGISPYVLHRQPQLWENPEGFDPERFAPEAIAKRARYTYLPFGAGPRQCIGNAFALMEAQIIIAMVAQRFRLELVPGHPIAMDPSVTLRPKHGIAMTLHRRAPSAPVPEAPRAERAPPPSACPMA